MTAPAEVTSLWDWQRLIGAIHAVGDGVDELRAYVREAREELAEQADAYDVDDVGWGDLEEQERRALDDADFYADGQIDGDLDPDLEDR